MRNQITTTDLCRKRKSHHLKIKDLSFLLNLDATLISRLEAGKTQSPKVLLGYHLIFNLSIESMFRQVLNCGYQEIIDRCFQLIEIVDHQEKNIKNQLRLESLNEIITHLTQKIENDEK